VPTHDGENFVLASELLFNNNQQISGMLTDPGKLPFLADFMKRKEDNMSRMLNEHLFNLVSKDQCLPRDALRATYNRLELHEMLQTLASH
jgi:twitching motility protein PilT